MSEIDVVLVPPITVDLSIDSPSVAIAPAPLNRLEIALNSPEMVGDRPPLTMQAEVAQAIQAGQPCYINGAGRIALASSNNPASMNSFGLAIADQVESRLGEILIVGKLSLANWMHRTGESTLVVGSPYFLSGIGQLSQIPPATGILIQVGRAITSNELLVYPSTSIVL